MTLVDRWRAMDLRWYGNRLRAMSGAEIVYRGKEALLARMQRFGLVSAARPPPPNLAATARPFIAGDLPLSPAQYAEAADRWASGRWSIFAIDYTSGDPPAWNRDPKTGRTAPLAFGKTLDYRDASVVGNIKYLWEPNRHLHLVTLAQAYRLSGERRYLEALRGQIESWLDQCPYLLGPNWASSLELAIRLINWSIVWQLVGGIDSPLFSDRRGRALLDRWLIAVYQHMHFIRGHLSRYSSANNHLIGELAGLFISAHAWPYWPQTSRWRRYAKKQLVREALLQNAPDGVNREQAISYQQFVLDFLLLAALAGRANGDDFPVEYWQRIERMLEFVAALMDARGNVPMIGDADDGYVVRLSQEPDFCPYRSLLATGAILFNRPDFKFKARSLDDKSRWLFGESGKKKFDELKPARPNIRRSFPDGGYYILGADFDTEREVRIIVDAGPLGYRSIAAHGHTDALAFTLSMGGHEFLIDPGTYSYHTDRKWRDYFRGTGAHNTLRVDGEDQSVKGGNFLWLKHARASCLHWEEGGDKERFVGMHDGYRRLADPVTHRREMIFDKHQKRLEIIDRVECDGRHVIERCWHFAEDVSVRVGQDGTIEVNKEGYVLRLKPTPGAQAQVHCAGQDPIAGWVSRRFDVKTGTRTVIWRSEIEGSSQLAASVECLLPAPSSFSNPKLEGKGTASVELSNT